MTKPISKTDKSIRVKDIVPYILVRLNKTCLILLIKDPGRDNGITYYLSGYVPGLFIKIYLWTGVPNARPKLILGSLISYPLQYSHDFYLS